MSHKCLSDKVCKIGWSKNFSKQEELNYELAYKNKMCAAKATHEKRTAPFATTQSSTIHTRMRNRACIFTKIKIQTRINCHINFVW